MGSNTYSQGMTGKLGIYLSKLSTSKPEFKVGIFEGGFPYPIPSMVMVYLYLPEWLVFMVTVSKFYQSHGSMDDMGYGVCFRG